MLDAALSFPTVLYTVPLGLCVVYWLFVVIGFVDIDVLDLDIDLDAVDGADEGLMAAFAGVLSALGLAGVPLTIVFSFLCVWGWMISALGQLHLLSLIAGTGPIYIAAGLGVMVAAFIAAVFLTRFSIMPMRKLFVQEGRAARKHDLVGRACRVSSMTVDEKWGEVVVDLEGNTMVVAARSGGDRGLKKDDTAVVVEFDEEANSYWIEPYRP